MRNRRRTSVSALPGFVLVLPVTCAFASQEGAAVAEAVLWIAAIILGAFAALVIGGGLLGAFRASQSGESILKASARGLLKGTVAFLVAGAVSFAVLTILGILWIAYSVLYVYVLNPS